MKVRLHIERLVVDGVSLERVAAPQLEAAVVAELHALIERDASSWGEAHGAMLARAPAPALRLPQHPDAAQLGRGIARALHGALANTSAPPSAAGPGKVSP